MRIAAIISVPVLLGGCVHLGARPMQFRCGDMLSGNIESYQSTPLFAELQRDAGYDECPNGSDGKPDCSGIRSFQIDGSGNDPIIEALKGWEDRRASILSDKRAAPLELPVLMLSGGGSWGAFGAGYLNQLGKRDWAVVTGVSTGALQGLFIAANDYAGLEAAYRIKDESELSKKNGLLRMLSRGSENDITPLRAKVMAYLLPSDGSESPLLRIARPDSPALSVATVEARSGDLKVVHITRLVRQAIATNQPLSRVAECVAGAAIASSSIPVRLTPVQIDGHSYTDGGVRSSVFDTGIGERMTKFLARPDARDRPHLYVIRNGPTIVFRDADDKDHPGIAEVDARPDILRLGLRGYSTIVNQNELMSIASLRINYPKGPISVISADGFNAPRPKPGDISHPAGEVPVIPPSCGPRPAALFDKTFMNCLADWGRFKARYGPDFIALSELEMKHLPATPGGR